MTRYDPPLRCPHCPQQWNVVPDPQARAVGAEIVEHLRVEHDDQELADTTQAIFDRDYEAEYRQVRDFVLSEPWRR